MASGWKPGELQAEGVWGASVEVEEVVADGDGKLRRDGTAWQWLLGFRMLLSRGSAFGGDMRVVWGLRSPHCECAQVYAKVTTR